MELPVTLRVNGVVHELDLDPRVTLLDALRERLGCCDLSWLTIVVPHRHRSY